MARKFGQFIIGAALLAVVELLIAIWVAGLIGAGWTLLILVAMSASGAILLRREGLRSWRRFREVVNAGGRPGSEVIDGLVGLGAGLLLFVPGLLTGAIGLACLIPPARRQLARRLQDTAARRLSPRVVNDLFGPRRVKATRTVPAPAAAAGPATDGRPPGGPASTDVIEGEIV